MRELNEILVELKSYTELVNNNQVDEETKNKINKLRQQYTNIYNVVNNEKNKKMLKRQINRRTAKRKRQYKNRVKAKFDQILKEKAIEQKHAEIDENLKKINDKIKHEKEAIN